MKGQRIGYVRVSTLDQNTERQLDGIELDRTFTDKASGRDTRRPALEEMLRFVREGDRVLVHSIDRLARSLDDLRQLVKQLTNKGVTVEFVKQGLTFTGEDSPIANMMLSVLGAIAEFEREIIRERQREGIAIAKAKGVYKSVGRHKALKPEQVSQLLERVASGESRAALAREFGIGRATLYDYIKSSQQGV